MYRSEASCFLARSKLARAPSGMARWGSQRLRRALYLVLCAVAEATACGQHSAYLSGGLFHFWMVGCFPRRWSRTSRWVRRIAILAGLVPRLLVLTQAPRVGAPTCPSACLGRGGATVQSVRERRPPTSAPGPSYPTPAVCPAWFSPLVGPLGSTGASTRAVPRRSTPAVGRVFSGLSDFSSKLFGGQIPN